jgi:hypothetical protein
MRSTPAPGGYSLRVSVKIKGSTLQLINYNSNYKLLSRENEQKVKNKRQVQKLYCNHKI